ncbi:MAG: methionine--tRNA ligase subunit beta [Balneolaceae bacterium]|nr:MAG: methionine--tRNA ligase subunit beta [Balneolaceae bacterium]
MLAEITRLKDEAAVCYETFRFREAIQKSMNLARAGNKYFTEMEPWHLRKNDPERCATVLNVCCQITAALSVLFDPVTPDACRKLREALNISNAGWHDITEQSLKAGTPFQKGDILFKKVEDEAIEAQRRKLEDQTRALDESKPVLEPLKNTITFEDFSKLDMRIGEVLTAERVPKSDKLLKLTVDIGIEKRTIMAGIAQHADPEELPGKKVTVVANLKPRKMMGVPSEGMILMAETPDGQFRFITSEADNGSIVS